jgi:hypothetical protein
MPTSFGELSTYQRPDPARRTGNNCDFTAQAVFWKTWINCWVCILVRMLSELHGRDIEVFWELVQVGHLGETVISEDMKNQCFIRGWQRMAAQNVTII